MKGRRRGRGLVTAASLLLHVVVLGWLAWPVRSEFHAAGPDLAAMSVELVAPVSPASPVEPFVRPAPRRIAERPAASAAPIARDEASAVVAAPSAVAIGAAPPAPAPDNVRAALRAGLGCTRGAARTRQEREACEEKLGQVSASTPTYAAPMDPAKRAYYDEAASAGAAGKSYGDPQPGAVTPGGAAYFRVLNCSVAFGAGKKPKSRQGEVRLGRTPCSIPVQGSFFTPEASVRKR